MGLFDWFRGAARPREQQREPFRMRVDDAFAYKEPGKMIVVGVVADGEVRPGDRLVLRTATADVPVTVDELGAVRRGDQVGILLIGAENVQVGPEAVLASAAGPLDISEAIKEVIDIVCRRLGVVYGGYHTFASDQLDGVGCIGIFFHVGEERQDLIQIRTGDVFQGTGIVYSALVGLRRTVIRDNKRHQVAEYSDLTHATVFGRFASGGAVPDESLNETESP